MHRTLILLAAAVVLVAIATPAAHAGNNWAHGFAWINDHDGDGIPNGQDPDWIRPLDGTGYQHHIGFMFQKRSHAGPAANGNMFQFHNQNRYKSGPGTPSGTTPLKVRLRLRDGSCKL